MAASELLPGAVWGLRHLDTVSGSVGIDLDKQLAHDGDGNLAPLHALHFDKASRFQFGKGPEQVRFRPLAEPRQLGHRLRLLIADDFHELAIVGGQETQERLDRFEAWLCGIGWRGFLAGGYGKQFRFEVIQTLNFHGSSLV